MRLGGMAMGDGSEVSIVTGRPRRRIGGAEQLKTEVLGPRRRRQCYKLCVTV